MAEELSALAPATAGTAVSVEQLLEQYGCGPIRFSGHNDALFERHCCSTMSSIRSRPGRASVSRPRPDRSGMCCRSAGSGPSAPTIG